MKHTDVRRGGGSSSTDNQRTGWVDCAKGVGISLVVFGHAWRGMGNAGILSEDAGFRFVDRWVYSFHMPLFFFLAGLFLVRSATRKPAGPFFREKAVSLLYPFLVWTVLLVLTQSMLGGKVNHRVSLADLPRVLLIEPTFWFLPVLFLSAAVTFAVTRLRAGLTGVGLTFVGLWAAWAATGLTGWSPLYFLGENGIYVALGAFVAKLHSSREPPTWLDRPAVVAICGTALTLLLTACVVARFDRSPWLGPVPAVIGIAASVLLARQLDRANVPVVRTLGQMSLAVYVASTFAMSGCRIGLRHLMDVNNPTIHLLLGTAAGLAFPVVLCVVARRLNVERLLFGCCRRTPAPNAAPAATIPHAAVPLRAAA